MITLYLLRHGETELSRDGRFCGTSDPPLTDRGRMMAEAFAATYEHVAWSGVYVSPLKRARQTLEPVLTEYHARPVVDDAWAELSYGQWEGQPATEIAHRDAAAYDAWVANPAEIAPPSGETARDVMTRVQSGLRRIAQNHSNGNILVVTHKNVIRIALCAVLELNVRRHRQQWEIDAGTVTILSSAPSGFMVRQVADRGHLPLALWETPNRL